MNGLVAGAQTPPTYVIPQLIGGMLGRYYFQKRYGVENWRAFILVVGATNLRLKGRGLPCPYPASE